MEVLPRGFPILRMLVELLNRVTNRLGMALAGSIARRDSRKSSSMGRSLTDAKLISVVQY